MTELFSRDGTPLPPLPPKEALERSKQRLERLRQLAARPGLSEPEKTRLGNLVRAEAAIVTCRENFLKRLN